jgi:hypothetical protein
MLLRGQRGDVKLGNSFSARAGESRMSDVTGTGVSLRELHVKADPPPGRARQAGYPGSVVEALVSPSGVARFDAKTRGRSPVR